jgi:hypothetical protein
VLFLAVGQWWVAVGWQALLWDFECVVWVVPVLFVAAKEAVGAASPSAKASPTAGINSVRMVNSVHWAPTLAFFNQSIVARAAFPVLGRWLTAS